MHAFHCFLILGLTTWASASPMKILLTDSYGRQFVMPLMSMYHNNHQQLKRSDESPAEHDTEFGRRTEGGFEPSTGHYGEENHGYSSNFKGFDQHEGLGDEQSGEFNFDHQDRGFHDDNGFHEEEHVSEHVQVTKPVSVPVYKHIGVPVPHEVKIDIPHPYVVNVPHPYPVAVPVGHPVPIQVIKTVAVPVEKKVPFAVEKHIPVPVEKPVPITVERHIPVPVEKPYPIKIPVYKTIHHHAKSHH